MSILFLLILGLGGLLVLGGIVGGSVLLTNQKTAPAAWMALLLVIPIVLIGGFVLFALVFTTRPTVHAERSAPRVETTAARLPAPEMPDPPPPVPDVETIAPVAETVEGETAEEDAAEENPAAEARPEWVDASPRRIASGDTYQMSVAVGPYLTRHECTQALPSALQTAVATYIADYLGPKAASRVRLSSDYIRENIVTEEFTETVDLDAATRIILEPDEAGPMVRLHVLMQFDRPVKAHIDQLWRRSVITGRLWLLGAALVGAMLLLSVLFAILKIDRATGGNRRGRLVLGVVGGMMLLVLTSWVALRMVGFQRLPDHAISAVPMLESTTTEILVEPRDPSIPQQAVRPVAVPRSIALLALPIGLLMLVSMVALLAFKKTRPVGLVMLTLLVVGALVMVA
ncbi:MAG: hypothetical protein V3R99_02285 [Thermoguttaceae bacterium]